MHQPELITMLETAVKASLAAGNEICDIYNQNFSVEFKIDNSPLTLADKRSNEIIQGFLEKTGLPILSEEGKTIPYEVRKNWKRFWLVDPLDGTKEFIKRNGEFTTNIALIEDGLPRLGVIYLPVQKSLYIGSENMGSYRLNNISDFISVEELLLSGEKLPLSIINNSFVVVGSKSHMNKETEDYISEIKRKHTLVEIISRGSSIKICMVAEGSANEYPRFAPTMEWDIAAGHAIVKFAGGSLINYELNKEMVYNNESLVNPWFLVKGKPFN
jgi:3'(2'), 5'-bisphosphate nucleotidase